MIILCTIYKVEYFSKEDKEDENCHIFKRMECLHQTLANDEVEAMYDTYISTLSELEGLVVLSEMYEEDSDTVILAKDGILLNGSHLHC